VKQFLEGIQKPAKIKPVKVTLYFLNTYIFLRIIPSGWHFKQLFICRITNVTWNL